MNPLPLVPPPSQEALERVRQIAERRLSAEEFNAYVNAPMTVEEREQIVAAVAWFKRRYPTPGQRLEAARRACKQWTQGMPRRGASE